MRFGIGGGGRILRGGVSVGRGGVRGGVGVGPFRVTGGSRGSGSGVFWESLAFVCLVLVAVVLALLLALYILLFLALCATFALGTAREGSLPFVPFRFRGSVRAGVSIALQAGYVALGWLAASSWTNEWWSVSAKVFAIIAGVFLVATVAVLCKRALGFDQQGDDQLSWSNRFIAFLLKGLNKRFGGEGNPAGSGVDLLPKKSRPAVGVWRDIFREKRIRKAGSFPNDSDFVLRRRVSNLRRRRAKFANDVAKSKPIDDTIAAIDDELLLRKRLHAEAEIRLRGPREKVRNDK